MTAVPGSEELFRTRKSFPEFSFWRTSTQYFHSFRDKRTSGKSLSSASKSNGAKFGTILARRQHKFERIKVGVADLRNQQVRFRISDIYLPDPLVILNQLHSGDVLEGRVLDISDSGTRSEQFAVIEVPGLDQIIIVPLASVNDIG